MLRSATPVIKEILTSYPKGGTDIATLARIIAGVTAIDRIHYIGYEVSSTNPILGAFRRFQQVDQPYKSEETVVEVRYALHLSDEMRRFVVYKELCHALEMPDGGAHVTEQAMDDLVTAFSMTSSDDQHSPDLQSFGIEALALFTAIEIICPLPRRQRLVQKFGNQLDFALVSANYGLPQSFSGCFKAGYMRTMEGIYKRYDLL
jgi:hypothetical protein